MAVGKKNEIFKVYFNVKFSSPKESGRIVAQKNVQFSDGNYEITCSKLANKNAKC